LQEAGLQILERKLSGIQAYPEFNLLTNSSGMPMIYQHVPQKLLLNLYSLIANFGKKKN
jgi:hypothetical protein